MSGQPIQLTGRSGQRYSFTLYPCGTPFKEVGGVYVAISRVATADVFLPQRNHIGNGLAAQYVGQTCDLSTRPENHHREDDFTDAKVCFIAAMVERDEGRRRRIEADLVAGLMPPLNLTAHG